MLLEQFCLAHCYRETSYLSVVIDNLRRRCKELCSEGTEPKLGNHTTLLPPFRAHPDEMRHFATGLNIARALYGEDELNRYAKLVNIRFFLSPDADACVAGVQLPETYHNMVEECRKQLSGFSEWAFPMHNSTFNPHICILEGNGIFEKLHDHLPELVKIIAPPVSFVLPFPAIMVKKSEDGHTRWREFDAKK